MKFVRGSHSSSYGQGGGVLSKYFLKYRHLSNILPVVLYCFETWSLTLNQLTNQITPWSRVLPEKLTVSQLMKIFPVFYGNRRFITVFTWARQPLCPCAFFFNWAPRHEGVLGDWRYSSTHYLTSAVDEGEWSASRPGRFIPKERAPGTHEIGGWVGLRAVMDAVVKRKIPTNEIINV
jgi:hypothetical protein